ncbi:MAG TPA: magnesium transporter CorA family protein [Verrucomicrobiae bacterium]|nr:magnesium transporter CorA family protein [Verrucomicrobiae bacterium]
MESLPEKISEDSVLWVDVEDPSDAEIKSLAWHFEFDELRLMELTEEGQRSKIEEHEDRISCILNFPKKEGFVSDVKMERLSLLVGERWIITVHNGYSDTTCAVYKKISTHGYFALSLSPSTDILLYIFLDLTTNEFFLISDLVHERLQNLTKKAGSTFRDRPQRPESGFGLEISKSRDQVLVMRQSIGPMREIVGKIARGEFALVSSALLPRFEDLYDRTISLIEVVDNHRAEISDITDILINVQTLTTNNIIRILTIISAIFLPLALIAEIYGTNFGKGYFIPGSSDSFGFYIMDAIMIAIAVTLIIIFRRRGWL